MQYFNDDVTIDNWEPSLPRPKIKPGAFDSTYGDGIEMREKRGNTDGDKVSHVILSAQQTGCKCCLFISILLSLWQHVPILKLILCSRC